MTALTFEPWHFLTTPLDELLQQCRVLMVLDADGSDGFMVGLQSVGTGELLVHAAPCGSEMDRETAIRGTLAAWYGVDTTGWPTEMTFRRDVVR